MRIAAGLVALTLGAAVPAGARVDPSAAGRFAVGAATLTVIDASRGRTLVTEVWYPASSAGRDTPLRRGRFPLVLLAHGFCGFRTNYEYLTVSLASTGFLVAAPDLPGLDLADCGRPGGPATGDPARDLSFLRSAFHDRAGPAARFVRAVRGRRAGLVGHSLGGAAVLDAAPIDAGFVAVVALAAAAGTAQAMAFQGLRPHRAVLVAGGTADNLLPFDRAAAPLFGFLPPPAFLLKIVGGTHSGFTDEDRGLTEDALHRQQALVRRYATAFLKRYLARDRRFARFLTPADAREQGADVELTARPR